MAFAVYQNAAIIVLSSAGIAFVTADLTWTVARLIKVGLSNLLGDYLDKRQREALDKAREEGRKEGHKEGREEAMREKQEQSDSPPSPKNHSPPTK